MVYHANEAFYLLISSFKKVVLSLGRPFEIIGLEGT